MTNDESTKEKLEREGYRIVMSITRDSLAEIIDRYKRAEHTRARNEAIDECMNFIRDHPFRFETILTFSDTLTDLEKLKR